MKNESVWERLSKAMQNLQPQVAPDYSAGGALTPEEAEYMETGKWPSQDFAADPYSEELPDMVSRDPSGFDRAAPYRTPWTNLPSGAKTKKEMPAPVKADPAYEEDAVWKFLMEKNQSGQTLSPDEWRYLETGMPPASYFEFMLRKNSI